MAQKTTYLTEEGLKKLKDELHFLRTKERARIANEIAEARAHGDLSENAEYHAAKERQSWIEGQVLDLEDKHSRAQVIDVASLSGSTVKFGATVTLIDEDTEEEKRYQIVGELEADLKAGRISISSPIARALIGKEEGDSVEVATPGGSHVYEIAKVEFIDAPA